MNSMLDQLKDQFKDEDVNQLETVEKELLYFDTFDNNSALKLGNLIVECAKSYNEDISIQITRMKDELIVFQYVGNTLAQRNLGFAQGKKNSVVNTEHCSLWVLAMLCTKGISLPEECIPVGGAFPIFVEGEMEYIVATSGLHNGNDFRAVIDALCKLENKKCPEYTGFII